MVTITAELNASRCMQLHSLQVTIHVYRLRIQKKDCKGETRFAHDVDKLTVMAT